MFWNPLSQVEIKGSSENSAKQLIILAIYVNILLLLLYKLMYYMVIIDQHSYTKGLLLQSKFFFHVKILPCQMYTKCLNILQHFISKNIKILTCTRVTDLAYMFKKHICLKT